MLRKRRVPVSHKIKRRLAQKIRLLRNTEEREYHKRVATNVGEKDKRALRRHKSHYWG
jgi:hypothetical protein